MDITQVLMEIGVRFYEIIFSTLFIFMYGLSGQVVQGVSHLNIRAMAALSSMVDGRFSILPLDSTVLVIKGCVPGIPFTVRKISAYSRNQARDA